MRIRKLLLTVLTICVVSGCSHSLLFEIPVRPDLPNPQWKKVDKLYCIDDDGAIVMLEREIIRDSYEDELKAVIRAYNKVVK